MNLETHLENLKRGDFIVVISQRKVSPPAVESFGPFMMPPREAWKPDGIPYEIQYLEWPFLSCLTLAGQVFAIDLQEFGVRKVSKKYTQTFLDNLPRKMKAAREASPAIALQVQRARKKEKPDPKTCPRCGERMREVLVEGTSTWNLVCPGCGGQFQGAVIDA